MYLWIDPWIRKLWYALIQDDLTIVDAGVLLLDQRMPTREDQYKRMQEIFVFFMNIVRKYTIKRVWIEKLYFTKFNQANAEFVYGIRWALAMLMVENGIVLHEYTPAELKKRITMNGQAKKALMVNVVTKLYNLQEAPTYHDTADALWLAWIVARIDQRRSHLTS
jgi:crossover junction endodeoxyribonuclease RuvC